MCNVPVSLNDVISVAWSYIHTGGLPLTNVSVTYTISCSEIDSTASGPIPIPFSDLESSTVSVTNLEFGFEYTFNITAQNSNGTSSVLCGPTLLTMEENLTSTSMS